MLHLLDVAVGVVLLGEVGIFWIKYDVLFVVLVKTEALWPAVLIFLLFQDKGQNILLSSEVLNGWSPDLGILTIFDHFSLLVEIEPREKHGVKAEVSGQSRKSVRHSEGIDLPADVWHILLLQFFSDESVSSHEIVNNVLIVGGGLIWRRHTTVDYEQLAILDKIPNTLLLLVSLPVPPHHEELHLSITESPLWVLFELLDDSSEHAVDGPNIKVKMCTIKILFDG